MAAPAPVSMIIAPSVDFQFPFPPGMGSWTETYPRLFCMNDEPAKKATTPKMNDKAMARMMTSVIDSV